jgi:hypothetical protein
MKKEKVEKKTAMQTTVTHEDNNQQDCDHPLSKNHVERNSNTDPQHQHWLK